MILDFVIAGPVDLFVHLTTNAEIEMLRICIVYLETVWIANRMLNVELGFATTTFVIRYV